MSRIKNLLSTCLVCSLALGVFGNATPAFAASKKKKAPTPVIEGGVRNSANFENGFFAPGSLAVVTGRNLTVKECSKPTFPFGQSLCGVRVKILPARSRGNNRRVAYARMFTVMKNEVKFQIPRSLRGSYRIQLLVRKAGAGVSASKVLPIQVLDTAPAIYTGSAQFSDTLAFVHEKIPAKANNFVSFYLTGLGETNPTVRDGLPAPIDTLAHAVAKVRVELTAPNGQKVFPEVLFAGRTPGFAGLDQVNIKMPALVTPTVSGFQGLTKASLRVCADSTCSSPYPLWVFGE